MFDNMKKRVNKTVNVLGTNYKIIFKTEEEDERLKKHGGYQDKSSKEIVIEIPKKGEEDLWGLKDLDYQIDKLIKHELIHAFLDESGLQENSWAENEEIVDWIANQFDKMSIAFDEATKEENSTPVAFDDIEKIIKKHVVPAAVENI